MDASVALLIANYETAKYRSPINSMYALAKKMKHLTVRDLSLFRITDFGQAD